MKLENGCRNLRRHWPEKAPLQRFGFILSTGDQENFSGLHDGLHPHRVCQLGHLVGALEEPGVRLDGALSQGDLMSAFGEVIIRLVKPNVGVAADAQKLQVDATVVRDDAVIPGAL